MFLNPIYGIKSKLINYYDPTNNPFRISRVIYNIENRKYKFFLIQIYNIGWLVFIQIRFKLSLFLKSIIKPVIVRLNLKNLVYKQILYNRKKFNSARRYLDPKMDLTQFFILLNNEKAKYVVLRWFDKINENDLEEDIDILVEDESVETVNKYLIDNSMFQTKPIDLYSVTGVKNTDYLGTPYYPPQISRKIILNRTLNKGIYVPSRYDYLLSLVFHVVYHKGEKSGINYDDIVENDFISDHPYLALINEHSILFQYKKLTNFKQMIDLLETNNWSTFFDYKRFLSTHNNYLEKYIKESKSKSDLTNMIVLIIRDTAMSSERYNLIKKAISHYGFTIIHEDNIETEDQKNVMEKLRSGNWIGSPPTYFFVLVFLMNIDNPELSIENTIISMKQDLRKTLNDSIIIHNHKNFIHSSDCADENEDYLNVLIPGKVEEIRTIYNTTLNDYIPTKQIFKLIKYNNRSKVELIVFKDSIAVKKTYKNPNDIYFNNEKKFYKKLSKQKNILPILELGSNYIITPFIEDVSQNMTVEEKKSLIKSKCAEILEFFKRLEYLGLGIVDLHLDNTLIDINNNLYFIDFEYGFSLSDSKKSYKKTLNLKFHGDIQPLGFISTYNNTWKKILESC